MNEDKVTGKRSSADVIRSKAFAIWVPAPVGLGIAWLSIAALEDYGWGLFLGLPLLVSFLSAFCHGFRRRRKFGQAYGVAFLSMLVLGGLLMLVSLDGFICLLMRCRWRR